MRTQQVRGGRQCVDHDEARHCVGRHLSKQPLNGECAPASPSPSPHHVAANVEHDETLCIGRQRHLDAVALEAQPPVEPDARAAHQVLQAHPGVPAVGDVEGGRGR